MKKVMIAALAAGQFTAAACPAQAAGRPAEDPAAQQRIEQGVDLDPAGGQAPAPAVENAPEPASALAAREDEPRKRKSTGDKVLTGAAVVLGIGALAVGGLLVAIFVD